MKEISLDIAYWLAPMSCAIDATLYLATPMRPQKSPCPKIKEKTITGLDKMDKIPT